MVTRYDGRKISKGEAIQLKGAGKATHVISKQGCFIDGLKSGGRSAQTVNLDHNGKGGASFANDPRGTGSQVNVEFYHPGEGQDIYIRVKPGMKIVPGAEIFVSYGNKAGAVAMGGKSF